MNENEQLYYVLDDGTVNTSPFWDEMERMGICSGNAERMSSMLAEKLQEHTDGDMVQIKHVITEILSSTGFNMCEKGMMLMLISGMQIGLKNLSGTMEEQ